MDRRDFIKSVTAASFGVFGYKISETVGAKIPDTPKKFRLSWTNPRPDDETQIYELCRQWPTNYEVISIIYHSTPSKRDIARAERYTLRTAERYENPHATTHLNVKGTIFLPDRKKADWHYHRYPYRWAESKETK